MTSSLRAGAAPSRSRVPGPGAVGAALLVVSIVLVSVLSARSRSDRGPGALLRAASTARLESPA